MRYTDLWVLNQIIVTGGDDRRCNVWAVGKPHALQNLSGGWQSPDRVVVQ